MKLQETESLSGTLPGKFNCVNGIQRTDAGAATSPSTFFGPSGWRIEDRSFWGRLETKNKIVRLAMSNETRETVVCL